jgi:hypothetical protein
MFQKFKQTRSATGMMLGLLATTIGFAQATRQDSLQRVQDERVLNRYGHTANPVALVQSSLPQHGFAGLSAGYTTGNYRRPMQAASLTAVSGETGGHRTLKGWTYHGYFRYGKRYDKDLAWSGVMDPYEGNPFIWADSSTGNWERDEVTAKIALITPQIKKFRFALAVDYTIGTGARGNDPRPFFRYRDMALRPGITYQLNKNSEIGLTGSAGFAKEEAEVGFYTRSASVLLYRLRGFGTFSKSPFVSGERRREEMRWQGSAYYARRWKDYQLLVSGYASQRDDEVIEGVATPQTTGYFTGIHFGGSAVLYKGDAHNGKSLSVNAFMHDGYADDVIFRAESASFSKQGAGAKASWWKAPAGKQALWQFTLHPSFCYYNYTDQGTRTGFDVSIASIAAVARYRRQLSGRLHLHLAPSIRYSLPVDDFYTSSRPNVITEALVLPDYLYFAARIVRLSADAGFELQPKGSALLHALRFSVQNIVVAEEGPFNNRNHFEIIYAIIF